MENFKFIIKHTANELSANKMIDILISYKVGIIRHNIDSDYNQTIVISIEASLRDRAGACR